MSNNAKGNKRGIFFWYTVLALFPGSPLAPTKNKRENLGTRLYSVAWYYYPGSPLVSSNERRNHSLAVTFEGKKIAESSDTHLHQFFRDVKFSVTWSLRSDFGYDAGTSYIQILSLHSDFVR